MAGHSGFTRASETGRAALSEQCWVAEAWPGSGTPRCCPTAVRCSLATPRGILTHTDVSSSTGSAGPHAQVAGRLVSQPGPAVDPMQRWQPLSFSVSEPELSSWSRLPRIPRGPAGPFLYSRQEAQGAITYSFRQRNRHSPLSALCAPLIGRDLHSLLLACPRPRGCHFLFPQPVPTWCLRHRGA